MSPMAGGEDCLSARGSAKSAAAVAAGPHGSSKGRSTKRKAANKEPAASIRTPRRRATGRRKAKAEEAVKRMSKGDIRWILNQKPLVPPSNIAALKRSNPSLVPRPGEEADEDTMRLYRLARAFDEMEERRPRLQASVRAELESKGFVELDDETVRCRAEVQAVIDREWPAIEAMMDALIVGDSDDSDDEGEGGDESGSEEGEDEEEDEVNY